MVSGMQSRDFRFNLQISEEQLTLIDASHLGYCNTSESSIPQVTYIYNLSMGLKTFQVLL